MEKRRNSSMAANGSGTLAFIDDFTTGGSSRTTAEIHGSILCAHVQEMHQNSLDHISSFSRTTVLNMRVKRWNILDWPSQSLDLKLIELPSTF